MQSSKNHWFRFYPTDWRGDPRLRGCDLATRGLWIEMLCLMHEGEPYGHLTIAGKPITFFELARMTGTSPKVVRRCAQTLAERGVFSETKGGLIYSRKMVRDYAKSLTNKENGSKGGKASLGNSLKRKDKPYMLEARSQSLDSKKEAPPSGIRGFAPKSPSVVRNDLFEESGSKRDRKVKLPDDWKPTPEDFEYGRQIGLTDQLVMAAAESMKLWAASKGARMVKWQAAFQGWMRRDAERKGMRRPAPPVPTPAMAMLSVVGGTDAKPPDLNPDGSKRRWTQDEMRAMMASAPAYVP